MLLLSVSRPNFEATFGPLGALMAEHAAWQAWIKSQPDLLGRSAVLGPKYSDMLQVRMLVRALLVAACLCTRRRLPACTCHSSLHLPCLSLSLSSFSFSLFFSLLPSLSVFLLPGQV